MYKTVIRFYLFIFILISFSCRDEDVRKEEVISQATVSFDITDQNTKKGIMREDSFSPQLVIAIKEEGDVKTVGYGRLNVFALDALKNESFNVQIYQIMEVEEGIQNLDSLFLYQVKANEASFFIAFEAYRGFGVVMEYEDDQQTTWYSNNSLGGDLDVDQTGSVFDIYEVISQEGTTFFKAKFNCKLFNDLGDQLTIESGELIFEL
ncbi:hypothetical protein SAMN04488029_3697 [Reichenbachiella faecimaris]|uniref:Lipoprotein n=1 Tax=Reichenbachiella faecimaris TaxID=692418 RepID=A0A1W2GPE9_REIFA|nr:hypothetical protein [Reichenbachiella faecimaris]SMD38228.1 hypothetical protein SAMN04488029_3697 [Reichenbachiella faecimaris]